MELDNNYEYSAPRYIDFTQMNDTFNNSDNWFEMEFKVADINDEILPGWRLASIADVENYMEQVKLELCGMTFHLCSLTDGTVGGPGYGYQITHKADDTLDHKLLINDTTISSSEAILSDMKEDEALPSSNNENNCDSNFAAYLVEHSSEERTAEDVFEQSSVTILTQEYKMSTETNVVQQNSNEILTLQTNDPIQPYIASIQYDIENSGNKVEGCVGNSNIEKGCEKKECHNIETLIQPSVVVDIKEDVVLKRNSCEDVSQTKDGSVGSGNDSDVSTKVSATGTPSNASDLESVKSTESSPSTRKKKAKRMSASMQRLTAKKESPELKRSTDLVSAAERKAKADELRKQKIIEQRKKDDDRRAAVLERRKKLEDVEREKKEALFKKLTTKDPEESPTKQSPMKKRYSLSTSNLSQLKKTKPVEANIDINATTVLKKTDTKPKDKVKPFDRPKSAMQRPTDKMKPPISDIKKGPDVRRPMTAFGSRTTSVTSKPPTKPSTRPSPSRQSLNVTQPARPNVTQPARPSTSLGISNIDKRKSAPPKQAKTSVTEKPPPKTMQKSKSAAGLMSKEIKKTVPTNTTEKKTEAKQPNQSPDKKRPGAQTLVKKETSKDLAEKKKEKERPPLKSSVSLKEKKENLIVKKSTDLPLKKKPSTSTKQNKKETKQMTEEEAKKALAERRKKAKEEAEAKAKAEREKDEVQRLKREEEEKRLAEQLKLEEERNAALLQQLKKEEEERRQNMMDEKEQREREEKERLEDEQRQREEEIERKAKLELDKIQKEQEKQELLLDQERVERKKRVEMIMARVSSKRNSGLEEAEPGTTPTESSSPPALSPPELSTDPARLKVDDILRSRGFGRSTEDITTLLDKHEESLNVSSNYENVNKTIDEQLKTDEMHSADNDVKSEGDLLGSVGIDSAVTVDTDFVPLDESPPSTEMHKTAYLEEAPIQEALEKALSTDPHLSNDNAVLKMDENYAGDFDPCSQTVDLNANDPLETKSDNVSNYVNHELSENVDEISLSIDDASIEQVNSHASLNDTNNNKDFLIENRLEPIVAWNENEPNSHHESNEKIQNHDTDGDNVCLDKLSNQGNNDVPIFMNGSQDGKVVNGSGDLHLVVDQCSFTVNSEDTSNGTESDQWNKFDERMKQIQPTVDQVVAGNEENKLWNVLEGKLELSECF